MESEKNGFTIVELLTVLAIMSILIGILLPTLSFIRNTSKNAAQRAQLATIEMALLAFRDDNGYYPPSLSTLDGQEVRDTADYCGAQKLAEALLGWDLMGFHPESAWRADGFDRLGPPGDTTYDPPKTRDIDPADGIPDTLDERTGSYLDRATTSVSRLGFVEGIGEGLYRDPSPLAANTFVICDVFGAKKVKIGPGKTVMAGTAILYYRANLSYRTIEGPRRPERRLYNVFDNKTLIDNGGGGLRSVASGETLLHPLGSRANTNQFFYDYIADPGITVRPWPYRPDSYILISAGVDGLYGTKDDICNFAN